MMSQELTANVKGYITPNAIVQFETDFYLSATAKILGSCHIEAYTYFGDFCLIGGVNIGRYCSIAPSVKIGLGEHEIGYVSTHPFFMGSKNGFIVPDGIGVPRDLSKQKHRPPKIGHDVWIGANAVICRGVTIGTGAIIAAGAIVNKDVQPYEIVGRTPAKHLKWRFSPEIINRLLASQWWLLEPKKFVGIDSSDPIRFGSVLKSMLSAKSYRS